MSLPPDVFNALTAAKAVASVCTVIGLSVVAERVGPRLAGLLSGLPLGAGIVTAFTGYELGATFAADAAAHSVPGFATTVVYVYLYALIALRPNLGRFTGISVGTLVASAGYGVSAYLVRWLDLGIVAGVPFVLASFALGAWGMSKLPNLPLAPYRRLGFRVVLFRATLATASILIITGVAAAVGPAWTGILMAFPMTLLPLVVIIHLAYSGGAAAMVLKHVPLSLGGVTSYCLAGSYLFPAVGMILGTILSLGAAALYLTLYSALARRVRTAREARAAGAKS